MKIFLVIMFLNAAGDPDQRIVEIDQGSLSLTYCLEYKRRLEYTKTDTIEILDVRCPTPWEII